MVFTGAELFTGNNAVLVPGALGRQYGWSRVLRNWGLVYIGNFAGALFFTWFLVVVPGVLSSELWQKAACGIAQAKVSMPWMTVFLRGVGANWLVCLAVWLGLSANDVPGRMMGLFFPIMCFVAIGYEPRIAQHVLHPAGYDARCAGHVRGVLHRQPDPLDPRQYRGRRPLRRGPLLASQQEIIGKIVRQRKSMNS